MFNFRRKKELENECVKAIAEINKNISIKKLADYYYDLQLISGIIDVCPINLAETTFNNKKASGQLDKFNRPVRV